MSRSVWTQLRALWNEPAPERPSKPAWWDRALALVFVPLMLVEGLRKGVLVERPGLVLIASVGVGAVWFRRTHPLPATAVAFGLARS